MKKSVCALMTMILLVTACGTGELPTQTPIPPTLQAEAQEETDTPVPPTPTSPPTQTATKPAAVATSTAALTPADPDPTPAPIEVEEITFQSDDFTLVGDLQIPGVEGQYPVIIMVHGGGQSNRTDSRHYRPLMERFLRAGYAVFSWDKPGTGESTGELAYDSDVISQRASILVAAIELLKEHPAIDAERIGVWGLSQGGYVMPMALTMSDDIAFMIVVSGPAMDSYDQGAYLVGQLVACEGGSQEQADLVQQQVSRFEKATTYQEYVENLVPLNENAILADLGIYMEVQAEDEWEPEDRDRLGFFNPIEVIEQTTIPVLAFFAERDRQVDPYQGAQAYEEALQKAGNQNFRVELIPGVGHNMGLAETGCLNEQRQRVYAPEYLDLMEEWLVQLLASAVATQPELAPPAHWPTKTWLASTPEEQGMDLTRLEQMMAYIDEHDVEFDSVIVVRYGYIVLEEYFNGYDQHAKHHIQCVTKGFTSALIGIALDKGFIESVDQKMVDLFPDHTIANMDARKQRITLEHLLTMYDGLDWHEHDYPYTDKRNTLGQMWVSKDAVQYVLDRPMSRDPGTEFFHNSGASILLGGIIEQATGQDVYSFARKYLLDPIGIGDVRWDRTTGNHHHTDGGLHMTPRDMARFGYLYLNHGTWDGQEIVSSEWVNRSTSTYYQGGGRIGFGYHWLTFPGTGIYAAAGHYDQWIYVIPEADMVVVFTGQIADDDPHPTYKLLQDFILHSLR